MSRIATKPSAAWAWSPSWARRQKRQSGGNGEHPLVADTGRAGAHELSDGRVEQPRRVVVAVAPPGPVHQDEIGAPDLRRPPAAAKVVRERAQPGASLRLDLRRDRVLGG